MEIKDLIELAKHYEPSKEEMTAMLERAAKVQEELDKKLPLQLP